MPIVHSAAAPFFFFHLFSRGRMEEMGETRVPGIKGECTLSELFNRAAIQSKFPLEGTSRRMKDHPRDRCERVA